MLSNHDIDELVKKIDIKNFKGYFYKDKLKKIQPNSSYIINLNSEQDENGNRNGGSHWTCLVTDDMKRAFYMDSYGEAEPNEIRHLAKSNQYRIGHSTKNIQSLMSNLCGFFCLGLIYFVNVSKFRTGNLINDASIILDLFEDLDRVDDVYKNEFILSLFFTDKQSKSFLLDNKLTNKFDIEDKLLQTD